MKPSAIACPYCGGTSLRRSRRASWLEILAMMIGSYPFRCSDCNQRSWISIWLFSRLKYAKCPKCLGMELTPWTRRHYRLNLWGNLLSTFGAHRYRCSGCRYHFLSFRPTAEVLPSTGQRAEAPPLAQEVEAVTENNAS